MIASKPFAGGTTNAKFIDFIRDNLCPQRFIKNVPKLITQDDCKGYYKHCGYGL
ncbi:MAG: hypothetical protein LBH00_02505 [Planctomycetaceae bacterium]|nr:hypothetical protein [Planctomycetaceae bacterium]